MAYELRARAYYLNDEDRVLHDKPYAEWSAKHQGCDLAHVIQSDDYAVVYYTGLKDKNGVEIYEGDIVSNRHDRGKVVFASGGFVATWKHRDYNPHLDVWIEDGRAQVEIIGNIYENPELLEQSK